MNRITVILIPLTLLTSVFIQSAFPKDQSVWHHTFYQYRVPVTVEVMQSGWNAVPISPSQFITAINKLEEMQYDLRWFDFNQLKVVEVNRNGDVISPKPLAGFYLIPEGDELVNSEVFGKEETVSIPTKKGDYYLLSYTYQGANRYYSPADRFAPILPTHLRDAKYEVSYEPKMLPKGLNQRERLLLSDGSPLKLNIKTSYVTGLKEISLRKVQIKFIANVESPGKKYWALYYQPYNGHHLVIPELRHSERPDAAAQIKRIGLAEKYLGATRYKVGQSDDFTAWFAETTVKLTPNTPAPAESSQTIKVTAAKNEKQSFQLVIKPKKSFDFIGITASDLEHGKLTLASSNISFYRVEYVPITRASYITPVKFKGTIGDPLIRVDPKKLNPREGNFALWVTINTPAGTPAGKYRGTLNIEGSDRSSMSLPLELEVYDFELPEYSPFYTSMGGTMITKTLSSAGETARNVAEYHHALTESDIRKLSRAYYTVMAENKFTAFNSLQYSTIGMDWSPPPEGYNVDKPGNYFKLYNWDFTGFNQDCEYFIDELKVNNFAIVHTNPSVIQMFKHLPGKKREKYTRYPSWLSLEWQAFRELTWVGLKPAEKDTYIEISQSQYDKLIMDFYGTIAKNLEKHGWLDRVYILVDETHYRGYGEYLNFLRLMKSDPLTARIRIAWCLQGAGAYSYKEKPEDDKHAFNGLIDHYLPDWRESYNWWEQYYFTDYDIEPKRKKLWLYNTDTTRSAIDSPGINNRATSLHVFDQGGSGFLRWSTFDWDRYRCETDNPWEYPWTDICNGGLAYFYPPRKDGPASQFDPTIVPSLRVMTYREGVDDYEYARILEDLVAAAERKGIGASEGKAVLADIDRYFYNGVQWSQNDAWYADLRDRMARAIVSLQDKIN